MEFVVVAILACAVFAFCFAVFLLKGRKEGEAPRLHTCGQGHDCRCQEKHAQVQPFDMREGP